MKIKTANPKTNSSKSKNNVRHSMVHPVMMMSAIETTQLSRMNDNQVCPCDGGCPNCFVQTKSKKNQKEDAFEKEANQVADRLVKSSTPSTASDKPLEKAEKKIKPKVKSKETVALAEEIENEEEEQIGSSPLHDLPSDLVNETSMSHLKTQSGSGIALDNQTATFFGFHLNHDFSKVKIFNDVAAARSATSVHARAYTFGENIVFNNGEYAPHTYEGKRLLAHELVHVKQQSSGNFPATIQCSPTSLVERIEIYISESTMIIHYDDEDPIPVHIQQMQELNPEVQYQVTFSGGSPRISQAGQQDQLIVQYNFMGDVEALQEFHNALQRATAPVPLHVSRSTNPGVRQPGGEPDGSPMGDASSELEPHYEMLEGNEALSGLLLDFINRFTGASIDSEVASGGLNETEVQSIIAQEAGAEIIIQYFTQGWNEYRATSSTEMQGFSILQETILTQRRNSNYNAIRNNLQIGSDQDGLGIFHRRSHIRLYDAFGQPLLGVDGSYIDSGYRTFEVPRGAVEVQLPGGLSQVLNAVRQVSVDQTVYVMQAVEGYRLNADLLQARVLSGWDAWGDLQEEWNRTMPIVVGFLSLHLVSMVLKQAGGIPRLIGIGLDATLRVLSWAFNILFVGELLMLALRCGRELSLIQRPPEGEAFDALSQRHMNNAIVMMRRLIIMMINFGLTVLTLQAARETAITLGNLRPPSGGGRGPMAEAVAVGPGNVRARMPGRATAGEAAGVLAGSPPPIRPVAVPVEPSQMASNESDPPGSGSGPGSSGQGSGTPGRAPRRRIIRPEPEPVSEPAAEPAVRGRVAEPSRAAEPTRPREPETSAEFESRMLARYTPEATPTSATYFWWRGGNRGTFRGFHQGLLAHARSARMTLARMRPRILAETTRSFLERHGLYDRYEAELNGLLRQITELNAFIRQGNGTPRDYVRLQQLENRYSGMLDWLINPVGNKRPDLIEIWVEPTGNRALVTDVTQRPGDPSHNLKTRFYVRVLRDLLGWDNVRGQDIRTATDTTEVQ